MFFTACFQSYIYSHSLTFPFSFFFTHTATTEIYTLSLHDALPIRRAPRCPVTYVHTHCTKTLTRRLDWARNSRCTAAHASQARKPLRRSRPVCRTAKPLPTTAIVPLSK